MENQNATLPRRTTAAERAQWVERFRASGLTQAEFAQQHGLNLGTFRQWLYRPPEIQPPASTPFQELRLENLLPSAQSQWGFELAVGNQLTLRWRQGLPVSAALELVRQLRAPC
jgi:hypothetical protein